MDVVLISFYFANQELFRKNPYSVVYISKIPLWHICTCLFHMHRFQIGWSYIISTKKPKPVMLVHKTITVPVCMSHQRAFTKWRANMAWSCHIWNNSSNLVDLHIVCTNITSIEKGEYITQESLIICICSARYFVRLAGEILCIWLKALQFKLLGFLEGGCGGEGWWRGVW